MSATADYSPSASPFHGSQREKNYPIEKLYLLDAEDIARFDFSKVTAVIFFAGNAISEAYVETARRAGCLVIDNSSAFRFKPANPLIISEINPEAFPLDYKGALLCNPNCTTIQLLLPLAPIIKLKKQFSKE